MRCFTNIGHEVLCQNLSSWWEIKSARSSHRFPYVKDGPTSGVKQWALCDVCHERYLSSWTLYWSGEDGMVGGYPTWIAWLDPRDGLRDPSTTWGIQEIRDFVFYLVAIGKQFFRAGKCPPRTWWYLYIFMREDSDLLHCSDRGNTIFILIVYMNVLDTYTHVS